MSNYEIEITLNSDAIIGSGSGFGAIIDQDVVLDSTGLPYIPGKRIKGCVRDTANNILTILESSGMSDIFPLERIDSSRKKSGFALVNAMFGEPGSLETAKLHFQNFYLPEYKDLRNWLVYLSQEYPEIYGNEMVTDCFTSIRQQTSLDDSGVAKRNSLRTFRLLNRELTFVGAVEANLNATELALLDIAIQKTENIGTKRNRGFGKITCKVSNLGAISASYFNKIREVYNA